LSSQIETSNNGLDALLTESRKLSESLSVTSTGPGNGAFINMNSPRVYDLEVGNYRVEDLLVQLAARDDQVNVLKANIKSILLLLERARNVNSNLMASGEGDQLLSVRKEADFASLVLG
jgi:hypothetical protein